MPRACGFRGAANGWARRRAHWPRPVRNALLLLLFSGRWRDSWRNLKQICKPMLLRLLGVPLLPVPLSPSASVGGIPYGVAIALGTMVFVAWTHR